jgi:hypothetical protein
MTLQEEIRTDLENEVFSAFGKEVTLIRKTSTYDDYGEEVSYTGSQEAIIAVPYNIVTTRESQEPFGSSREGELDMAIKYDQDISINDYIIMEGVTYEVKEIAKNFLPDNVVTIIRLTKIANLVSNDA